MVSMGPHHEVGDDGEGADAHASEGRSGGDVAVQLLLEALHRVPVTLQHRDTCVSQSVRQAGDQAEIGNGWMTATQPQCGHCETRLSRS